MEEQVGVTHEPAPRFGDARASKEQVYAFYKYWEGFSTIKQFAYVDEYDARQAPNRRIKRLIEADN
jgi:DnaJ family protein A protein 5